MRGSIPSVLISVLCLILAHRAGAQDNWSLTTADFQSQSVRLLAFDAGAVRVAALPGGEERVVPMYQFLEISRDLVPAASPQGGIFYLHLANGDRLRGAPVQVNGEDLSWNSPVLSTISIGLRRIVAITRSDMDLNVDLDTTRAEDVVLLTNGDSVRGIVASMGAEGITLGGDAGGTVALDSLKAVLFASAGQKGRSGTGEREFRVLLGEGSMISAPRVELEGDSLKVWISENDARTVAMTEVGGIEQMGGPVRWLSSLAPVKMEQRPYFGSSAWTARFDKTVTGEPIRFGSRTYAHGIGVHAYSSLEFEIPPPSQSGAFQALVTRYAISGDQPYADVTVRIYLDGQIAHEKTEVRAGAVSPAVVVPLGSAKMLRLEVDYGKGYDVQDRFVWIEPALLRQIPAPAAP